MILIVVVVVLSIGIEERSGIGDSRDVDCIWNVAFLAYLNGTRKWLITS